MSSNHAKTLKDITELIVDCEHKTAPAEDYETGYLSIRTPNIGRGRLILEGVNQVSFETYVEWTNRAIPRAGDLILAREAPVGNVAIVPPNLTVCLGQRTVLIRPDENQVEPDYLVYLLNGEEVQAKFRAYASGATVPHLNMADIRSLELPELPPRETQRRIAAILSAYDDLIENNTQRIRILEEMAQALYREWFVHFRFPGHEDVPLVESTLGPIPAGWAVGRLDDALVLQRGFDLPTKERNQGDVPVYAATGPVGTHDEPKVPGPGVVTGRSGSLGTVTYIDRDFWPLNTTLWVREFRRATPLYAYYLLRELQLEQYNSGAAVPTLNRNDIHRLPVIIPSHGILQSFDRILSPVYDMMKVCRERNAVLRETCDLLLPRLVSGEIDVSELEIALPE